jgi:hypothetical protein
MDAATTGGRGRGREGERVGRKAATEANPVGARQERRRRRRWGRRRRRRRRGEEAAMGCCEPGQGDEGKKEKIVGPTGWTGEWRASKNGGWEGEFGGVCKIEACLEALLELVF